jgi:hypothetical protein
MSHIDFETLFAKFKEKFPPVGSLAESDLQLTTPEIVEFFTDFNPLWKDSLPVDIVIFLEDNGYKLSPMEYNGKISFKWLIKKLE